MEKFDNKTFLQVWDRVTEISEPVKTGVKSDKETLCAFMDRASFAQMFYSTLGQRSPSKEIKEVISLLGREEGENLRELMSAYFILTGDTYAPERVRPYFSSVLDGVRTMYIGENENVEAYHRAAMETEKGHLTDLYHRLASREEKHGEKLMALIKKILR